MRFQPNGRLVIAGDAIAIGTGQFFALARYRPGGSLDDGFGIAGRVVTPLPPGMVHAFANALLLRPDGRMVAAGTAESVDQAFFALARYRSNGSLDARFGTDGQVTTPIDGDGFGEAAALQPDGRILLSGAYDQGFATARYLGS